VCFKQHEAPTNLTGSLTFEPLAASFIQDKPLMMQRFTKAYATREQTGGASISSFYKGRSIE
jgi:hypothetical protein